MKLFEEQERLYDLFINECQDKTNSEIDIELKGVCLCYGREVRQQLSKRTIRLKDLRDALIECGLNIANRSGFEKSLSVETKELKAKKGK